MKITIYKENGLYGYLFCSGPVVHTHGGFLTESQAQSAGRQDRAETISYAHRFEPRALVEVKPDANARFVTGWIWKCACGEVRRATDPLHDVPMLIRDDSGPCSAAVQVKARAA
jgi:hypothetical protein